MEVDTGASVSIMSENRYHELWPRRGLSTSTIRLQTYSKEPITVVGSTDVQVVYQGQKATLPLVVVKGDGPTLLGGNWLAKIRLNWDKIHYMQSPKLTEPARRAFSGSPGDFQRLPGKRLRPIQVLHPTCIKSTRSPM